MQKISPFLWFDNQAEEAMNFYLSVFKDSKAGKIVRYGDAGPGPKGSVMVASFELNGHEIHRAERRADLQVHRSGVLFRRLRDAGGGRLLLGEAVGRRPARRLRVAEGQVRAFLADRAFALPRLLGDPDAAKANRVMQAMMQMKKIDIAGLEAAGKG